MSLRTGDFYTRAEHGGHPVKVSDQGLIVTWPQGPVVYPSARQALIAITNQVPGPHPGLRDPRVSFDKYFRVGRYAIRNPPTYDLLNLLREPAPAPLIKQPRGIDLAKRGHEVRKLFYAGFARRVLRYGYDPEDVLQDIYQGILVRNEGKCPFDPSKSSFGHYVHMICGCIVSNYHRRYSRLTDNEQFGVLSTLDGESVILDVQEADLLTSEALQDKILVAQKTSDDVSEYIRDQAEMEGLDPTYAEAVLDLVVSGHKKSEIAKITGLKPVMASRYLKMIREAASNWIR